MPRRNARTPVPHGTSSPAAGIATTTPARVPKPTPRYLRELGSPSTLAAQLSDADLRSGRSREPIGAPGRDFGSEQSGELVTGHGQDFGSRQSGELATGHGQDLSTEQDERNHGWDRRSTEEPRATENPSRQSSEDEHIGLRPHQNLPRSSVAAGPVPGDSVPDLEEPPEDLNKTTAGLNNLAAETETDREGTPQSLSSPTPSGSTVREPGQTLSDLPRSFPVLQTQSDASEAGNAAPALTTFPAYSQTAEPLSAERSSLDDPPLVPTSERVKIFAPSQSSDHATQTELKMEPGMEAAAPIQPTLQVVGSGSSGPEFRNHDEVRTAADGRNIAGSSRPTDTTSPNRAQSATIERPSGFGSSADEQRSQPNSPATSDRHSASDGNGDDFEVPSDYFRDEHMNDAVLLTLAAKIMRRNPTARNKAFLKAPEWKLAALMTAGLDWEDWDDRSLGLQSLAEDRSAVAAAFRRFRKGPRRPPRASALAASTLRPYTTQDARADPWLSSARPDRVPEPRQSLRPEIGLHQPPSRGTAAHRPGDTGQRAAPRPFVASRTLAVTGSDTLPPAKSVMASSFMEHPRPDSHDWVHVERPTTTSRSRPPRESTYVSDATPRFKPKLDQFVFDSKKTNFSTYVASLRCLAQACGEEAVLQMIAIGIMSDAATDGAVWFTSLSEQARSHITSSLDNWIELMSQRFRPDESAKLGEADALRYSLADDDHMDVFTYMDRKVTLYREAGEWDEDRIATRLHVGLDPALRCQVKLRKDRANTVDDIRQQVHSVYPSMLEVRRSTMVEFRRQAQSVYSSVLTAQRNADKRYTRRPSYFSPQREEPSYSSQRYLRQEEDERQYDGDQYWGPRGEYPPYNAGGRARAGGGRDYSRDDKRDHLPKDRPNQTKQSLDRKSPHRPITDNRGDNLHPRWQPRNNAQEVKAYVNTTDDAEPLNDEDMALMERHAEDVLESDDARTTLAAGN